MNQSLEKHKTYLDALWAKIEKKVSVTSRTIADSMPYTTKQGHFDDCQDTDTGWWTNTFWCGILWHMYRETGDNAYRTWAERIEAKLDKVLHAYHRLDHDTGFLWLLSAGMNHTLTGNETSRSRMMLAASTLASRFNLAGGYIRAWNAWDDTTDLTGWAIIDCMMNLPLLFWASHQIRDKRFARIAMAHADKAMAHFVRPDGSCHHIVVFDSETGAPVEYPAGQGFASGSSWSRGQAWAVYGFAQSYLWTEKKEYLDTAKRVAHYVLSALSMNNFVPKCDYRQPEDSALLDSSAGAITACGLIDIARGVPEEERALYLDAAVRLLQALDTHCAVWDMSDDALLTNGTSRFHLSDGRYEVGNGALIYGDLYFVEAVCKLRELMK